MIIFCSLGLFLSLILPGKPLGTSQMNSVLICQRAESLGFYSEGETVAHVTGSILGEVRDILVLSALLFSFRGSKNRTDF